MASIRRAVRPFVVALGAVVTAAVVAGPAAAAPSPAAASVAPSVAPSAGVALPTAAFSAKGPFPGLGPAAIRNRSAAAMKAAPPFRVQGFEVFGGVRYTYDLHIGQRAAIGTYTSTRGTLTGLRVGNTVYWQYDAKAIESLQLKPEVEGKWIRIAPNSGPEWELAVHTLSPTAWSKWVAGQPVGRRATGPKFAGVPTVRLDVIGPKGGSLYVSATGPAYLRYAKRNDRTLQFALTDFGTDFAADEPSSDQIFDPNA